MNGTDIDGALLALKESQTCLRTARDQPAGFVGSPAAVAQYSDGPANRAGRQRPRDSENFFAGEAL